MPYRGNKRKRPGRVVLSRPGIGAKRRRTGRKTGMKPATSRKMYGSRRVTSRRGAMMSRCVKMCTRAISRNIRLGGVIHSTDNLVTSGDVHFQAMKSNEIYWINETQAIMNCIFRANEMMQSVNAVLLSGRADAFIENFGIKFYFGNFTTSANPPATYSNPLQFRLFTGFNETEATSMRADNATIFQPTWQKWTVKSFTTNAAENPGLSAIWHGAQLDEENAATAGTGTWQYLTRAPFNDSVIRFPKQKRFYIYPKASGGATTPAFVKEHAYSHKIARNMSGQSTLLVDELKANADSGMKMGFLVDNQGILRSTSMYKYIGIQVDDLSLPATGEAQTLVAGMRAEWYCNLRLRS